MNLRIPYNEQPVDTDVFVVIENESDSYDFVTIDEDTLYDAIVIDMSQYEFADAISVNFDEDSFVSIDEDPIFISDFTMDD